MPHYKTGEVAKVGDVVSGHGYNIRGRDKQPIEIIGVVIGITPDATSCNCVIAVFTELSAAFTMGERDKFFSPAPRCIGGYDHSVQGNRVLKAETEYGALHDFVKIGEIPLPPADAWVPGTPVEDARAEPAASH